MIRVILTIMGIFCIITWFVLSSTSGESIKDIYPTYHITDIYIPSGYMGDVETVKIVDGYTENVESSPNECIQISYDPEISMRGNDWAGVYWQYPNRNWGKRPGYDLSGYTKITFRARGEKGNEVAEFKFGGIKDERYPYSDSVYPAKTTGKVTLSSGWKNFTIDLKNSSLSNVIGGFCWATSQSDNPEGCTIYVDDVVLK